MSTPGAFAESSTEDLTHGHWVELAPRVDTTETPDEDLERHDQLEQPG
jgi:hypothetical protein